MTTRLKTQEVRNALALTGLSERRLASTINVCRSTLRRASDPSEKVYDLRPSVAERLAKGLGVDLDKLQGG